MLGALLGGLMQAVHGAAKGLDEAAEISGAPPIVRAATGSISHMTGALSQGADSLAENGIGLSVGGGMGSIGGLGSDLLSSVRGLGAKALGHGAELVRGIEEVQQTQVAAAPVLPAGVYEASFNDIQVPPGFAGGSGGRGAGMGV